MEEEQWCAKLPKSINHLPDWYRSLEIVDHAPDGVVKPLGNNGPKFEIRRSRVQFAGTLKRNRDSASHIDKLLVGGDQ